MFSPKKIEMSIRETKFDQQNRSARSATPSSYIRTLTNETIKQCHTDSSSFRAFISTITVSPEESASGFSALLCSRVDTSSLIWPFWSANKWTDKHVSESCGLVRCRVISRRRIFSEVAKESTQNHMTTLKPPVGGNTRAPLPIPPTTPISQTNLVTSSIGKAQNAKTRNYLRTKLLWYKAATEVTWRYVVHHLHNIFEVD